MDALEERQTDDEQVPWAEMDAEEREEFWDSIRVARDEERYAADWAYRRRIDEIASGFSLGDEREYPMLVHYHEIKVLWYPGESPADALKHAQVDDMMELHERVKGDPIADGWLDVEEISDWQYAGYEGFAYDSRGNGLGPLLPNGGMSIAEDRRTAEWQAYHEDARRSA